MPRDAGARRQKARASWRAAPTFPWPQGASPSANFLNAGQTCVAPDYVLCAAGLEQPLAAALRGPCRVFFGPDALALPDYNRIVNEKHFRRLCGLLEGQDIAFGGRCDESTLRIEPTVLLNVPPESPVMQEEIFGPILPILTVPDVEGAIRFISAAAAVGFVPVHTQQSRRKGRVRAVSFWRRLCERHHHPSCHA